MLLQHILINLKVRKRREQASYNKMILKTNIECKPKLCKLCNNYMKMYLVYVHVAPEMSKSGLNEIRRTRFKNKNIEQQQDKENSKKAQKIKKKQQI